MIAKIYAAINNHVPAYANALIAVESGEISRNDEFFVEQSKEIFPTPEDIIRNKRNLLILILFFFFSVNAVLILEPGTYRIRIPFGKRNIVIIGTALRPPPEGYAQKNFLMLKKLNPLMAKNLKLIVGKENKAEKEFLVSYRMEMFLKKLV